MIARLLRTVPPLAAALLLLAGPAHADSIFLGGTVTNVDPLLGPTIQNGDSFAATVQVNAGTADTNGDPTEGEYPGAATSVSFSVGGFNGSGTGGAIFIEDAGGGDGMRITFFPTSGFGTVSGSIGIYDLEGFFFEAQRFDGNAFTSDSLADALALITLGTFDSIFMTLNFSSQPGESLTASITLNAVRVVPTSVPEPSTLALLLATGLLLATPALRPRRRR